jgi:hypothetical protein
MSANTKQFRLNEIKAINRNSLSNKNNYEMTTSSQNLEKFLFYKNSDFNPETFNLNESVEIYPDKKDACKRFIQLHKTYQE